MDDSLYTTPQAEKLAAELRALQVRREREALAPAEEARYAELLNWRQSRGADPAGEPGAAAPGVVANVPNEWVSAFDDQGPPAPASDTPASEPTSTDDLVGEWQSWQARHASSVDPFSSLPDAPPVEVAPTYEEVIAARAQVLGEGTADLHADRDGPLAPADDFTPSPGEQAAPPATDDDAPLEFIDDVPQTAAAPPLLARGAATPEPGAQRVIIHLLDGQVRRGAVQGVELGGDTFSYNAQSGATESLARTSLRAIFFLRHPGAPAPQPVGRPVRVTFRDGRELAGSSADHEQIADAFTLVPSDPHTNATLVWIARAAVRQVTGA